MSALLKQTTIQYPMSMVFEFNFDDTMVNTSGNSVALGALTSGSNTTWDIGYPPPGAVVIGGRVIVLTAFNSTANTVDVGDSDDPDRYTETGAIDLQDADAPASGFEMLGDGKSYSGSQAIRLTFSNTVGAATAGKGIVVVTFVVPGRANENLRTVAP